MSRCSPGRSTGRARPGRYLVRCRATFAPWPSRQYVAEEIATDAADGLITRREALRRLGLMGLTVAGRRRPAGRLRWRPRTGPPRRGGPPTPATPAASATTTTTTAAAAAADGEPSPSRARGVSSWAPSPPPRDPKGSAAHHPREPGPDRPLQGAPHPAGGRRATTPWPSTSSPGRAAPARSPTRPSRHRRPDRRAPGAAGGRRAAPVLDELLRRAPEARSSAVMGFCFGGGMTLVAPGRRRSPAWPRPIPFYGTIPEGGRLHRLQGRRPRRLRASSTPGSTPPGTPPPPPSPPPG